jgi:hypothetical protein
MDLDNYGKPFNMIVTSTSYLNDLSFDNYGKPFSFVGVESAGGSIFLRYDINHREFNNGRIR